MDKIVKTIAKAFRNGNKVLICGNGGSAAMAQHMSAEFVGIYENDIAFPAITLSADTSIITAISNDLGYKYIFSRQVDALGKEGDVLIAFSTSGKSKNILEAIKKAKSRGMSIIDMPRCKGKTQYIQEKQLHLTHEICSNVKRQFKHYDEP